MQKSVEVYFYVRGKPRHSTKTSDPGDDAVWRGIQRAMKITTAIILIAALHVSATGTAQKISFTGENAPLTTVFNAIEDQLGFGVLMPHKLMESSKPVTIKIENGTLDELLQKCFEFQPWKLSYTVTGHTIYISEVKPSTIQLTDLPPGKMVKVNGVVLNEAGEVLAGANVTIKQTGKGTVTNARGEFNLGSISTGSIVVFSFIGYASQESKINEPASFKIYLKLAKNELDKAVVQAYGVTTQRLTTGNIGTVSSEQIERQPVMNPLSALEGQIPGVIVTQDNGYASAPFRVEIRGRSVLDGNLPSEPLYIIDGVPLAVLEIGPNSNYQGGSSGITQNGFPGPAGGQSPLFSINPDDIESITVLKDADATAIYGSRGANGVVIINTKKGKPGKTIFELKANQGEAKVTEHYSLLNTQQYLAVRHAAFTNDGIAPNAGSAYDLLVWDTTRYTDWQKASWGNIGQFTDLELAMSGGDNQNTFRISGAYHRQTEVTSNYGADQRASVQFNLTHKSLDQRLVTSFTSSYSYVTSNLIYLPGGATLPPDAPPIYNAEGQLNYAGWTPDQGSFPFAGLLQPYSANTGYLNSEVKITYAIVRGLTAGVSLGYSTYHNSQSLLMPIASQNPAQNPLGSARFGANNGVNSIIEPQLDYKTAVGMGKFSALLGATSQSSSGNGNTIYGIGFTNDHLLNSVANAATTYGNNNSGQYKYIAGFIRLNYNWADKYILNLSARRDGSSRFGPGKQFGNFGSVGAAWIFSEEGWFKEHLSLLSLGKVRASYGITGSDDIPPYQYISAWSATSVIPYIPNGAAGYQPSYPANPNLEWQSDRKLEGAIDLGFLKDRLTIEGAVYRNRCGNQLINQLIPAITGFTGVYANSKALIQNFGYETILKAKLIDKRKFSWSESFNFGWNRNKLIAYPDLAQSPYAATFTIGESLNIVRLLHYTNVDPQTGQYSFTDKNHDGVIENYWNNGNNDFYNKDLSVKYEGGLTSDFRYSRFQLSFFFVFRSQLAVSEIFTGALPGEIGNQSTKILNHWVKPGDNAPFARLTTGQLATNTDFDFFTVSDGVYSNGAYIRLKNLSLAYDVPLNPSAKKSVQGIRIFVRGENLFLFTKYNGLDPQTPSLNALPFQTIITFGAQINL